MPNVYGAPEITVEEVGRMREDGQQFILMDVREKMELNLANLGQDVLWIPLSELAARRLAVLPQSLSDRDTEIVVFCHTGVRSAQVTAWLRHEGWTNVKSMEGGIDAYARQVDPSVGRY